MMKKLLTLLMVFFVTSVMIAPEAQAKRFGGGSSFGKSFKYSRPAKKPAAPQQNKLGQQNTSQAAPGGAAAKTGMKGGMMGGMLGGLLAGGLLSALFFGGAFEGLQIMDILMVAGLAFIGFKLFKAFVGGARQQEGRPAAYAGGAGQMPQEADPAPQPVQQRSSAGFTIPEIGSSLKGEPLSITPEWFSEPMFMAEADSHFREVQDTWNKGDFEAIKGYVTPEFFDHVKGEYDSLNVRPNTRIISLDSQLLDLLQDGEEAVAAILFSGTLVENDGPYTEFAEIWHVRHPLNDADGDWKIDSIQQTELEDD